MKVVGATYDVLVLFGQNILEVTNTTREAQLEYIETELKKPVGERAILTFSNGKATCLFDPNIPGLILQVISKRDFESLHKARQLAQPRIQPPLPRRPA